MRLQHTYAEILQRWFQGSSAWTLPAAMRLNLKRVTRNQHGTVYRFKDDSGAFVPKGTAAVIVRQFKR